MRGCSWRAASCRSRTWARPTARRWTARPRFPASGSPCRSAPCSRSAKSPSWSGARDMADDAPLQAEAKVGDLRGVLPAGTALRGYELKSILGQGAFGITYRARDTTLHRDVAIKEYLPTSLALREGRTTVLPRSPNHPEHSPSLPARFL